jgi:glycosyltransferase involved in cell wall biosynthesis
MKDKRVLILGYFGYQNNQLDGQTIKTRNALNLLRSNMKDPHKIHYFDTQNFQDNIASIFFMFWKVINSKMIIYIPAHNNLKYIFPFLFLVCKLLRIKILYIVVGGWLYEYLQNKPLHRLFLKRIYGILAENKEVIKNLSLNYNFNNLDYLPNFRIHNYKPELKKDNGLFKIVFMARVMKIKGIDTLFKLCQYLEGKYNEDKVSIDIYGPIPNEEKNYFFDSLKSHTIIKYKGVLDPKIIYTTLNNYDILVFPTRYPGEGFPGTILDAYISGLPVIASNWRFIPEFIDKNKTGYIFDVNHPEELFHYVDYLIENPQILNDFSKNAIEKSKEYSSDVAWNILKPYLNIKKNEG